MVWDEKNIYIYEAYGQEVRQAVHQPGYVCKTITAFSFAYLLRKNQALQSVVYCLSGTRTVREMKS